MLKNMEHLPHKYIFRYWLQDDQGVNKCLGVTVFRLFLFYVITFRLTMLRDTMPEETHRNEFIRGEHVFHED